MLVYAATNFVLPSWPRALTLSDISSRVMSPMVDPVVFVAALAADAVVPAWVGVGVVAVVTALWVWQGLAWRTTSPHMPSSGSRTIYSPQLHDLVDELADDAQVLTNNPWGVWWQNQRQPTLFAFTRPRPGNGIFPISGERTLMWRAPSRRIWRGFPRCERRRRPRRAPPDLLESSISTCRTRSQEVSCIGSSSRRHGVRH